MPKAAPAPKGSALLFASLGDETRLRLVSRLSAAELSIASLTAGSKMTRQAVTKHLRVLENARLVECRRRGRETIWRLDRQRLEDVRRYLDLISAQWDTTLGRLRDLLEAE